MERLQVFLDASPSPWHAVSHAVTMLGPTFTEASAQSTEPLRATGYVTRGGALIAWRSAAEAPAESFRIVGAHTDSPCLRIAPNPDLVTAGWQQLAVEVYGGALLNSWLDRDLGLAGRLFFADGTTADVLVDEPLCRVPQLAIHLDRGVNDRGLVLNEDTHLRPVWGTSAPSESPTFGTWLAGRVGRDEAPISWDLSLFDRAPAALIGHDRSMLASGRLDNQVSCWAAVEALSAARPSRGTSVIALFDHEEVGSASTTGAAGPLLEHVLERLVLGAGGGRAAFIAALARSLCISADNAHAVHPNYPERSEVVNAPIVNRGPAIKRNSNQRYATSAGGAAVVTALFHDAGCPTQTFMTRNSMPCGSTIGPITATRLGIETVDVGVPQLSMHSARELCGALDPPRLVTGLTAFLGGPSSD